ncbi:MAG: T9SS type A sorting domain-containing protein [Chitinophagales bacterium]
MKPSFFCLLFLLPFLTKSQNLPQCDSLVITCCAFDSLGLNTISIYVANPSSELFAYPGFVLLDNNLDTIAKETVNYFGIGTWPQAHTMTIVAPLTLPFTGYLELHTLFYQEFACSFPFTIADTTTTINEITADKTIVVFPNPFVDELHIALAQYSVSSEVRLSIVDVMDREVYTANKKQLPATLSLNGMKPGIYFLRITNTNNQPIQIQKVVVGE